VAKEVVHKRELRHIQLSDFAVVALYLNIKESLTTKATVDMFENVYVRGAKPRLARIYKGRPALAPDGTVLSMDGVGYLGSTKKPPAYGTQTTFANTLATRTRLQ